MACAGHMLAPAWRNGVSSMRGPGTLTRGSPLGFHTSPRLCPLYSLGSNSALMGPLVADTGPGLSDTLSVGGWLAPKRGLRASGGGERTWTARKCWGWNLSPTAPDPRALVPFSDADYDQLTQQNALHPVSDPRAQRSQQAPVPVCACPPPGSPPDSNALQSCDC